LLKLIIKTRRDGVAAAVSGAQRRKHPLYGKHTFLSDHHGHYYFFQ
jgi:hypothetical protein